MISITLISTPDASSCRVHLEALFVGADNLVDVGAFIFLPWLSVSSPSVVKIFLSASKVPCIRAVDVDRLSNQVVTYFFLEGVVADHAQTREVLAQKLALEVLLQKLAVEDHLARHHSRGFRGRRLGVKE